MATYGHRIRNLIDKKKQNYLKNKTKTNRKILHNSVLCLQFESVSAFCSFLPVFPLATWYFNPVGTFNKSATNSNTVGTKV